MTCPCLPDRRRRRHVVDRGQGRVVVRRKNLDADRWETSGVMFVRQAQGSGE